MRALSLALLLALAACGSAGDTGTAEPEASVADTDPPPSGVLSDRAYRFCNVPGADAEEAREWCPLLEDLPEDRCPGLRATCEEGAEETVLDTSGCNAGSGKPTAAPAPPPKRPDEPWELEPWSCDVPDSLGSWIATVLKWVAAIGIALGVLVVLRLVLGALGWWRRRQPERTVEQRPVEVSTVDGGDVPELPSEDLLAAARRALADGRWGEVVLLARHAALRQLGDAGRVRLHRSRTDREYLRTVRRDPTVHEPLGEVLHAAEQHRWGGFAVGREVATRVLGAAERILRVVAVGVLAVLLLGAGDDWRFGPEGDAALFDLFAKYGYQVSWRLRGLASIGADDETDVLVLDLSGIDPGDKEWAALRDWVDGGHLLVVAGDHEGALPELGTRADLPLGSPSFLVSHLDGLLPPPEWPEGPLWGWKDPDGLIWVASGNLDPSAANAWAKAEGAVPESLAEPGDPLAVVQVTLLGGGAVLAISDARLLWNGALVSPENEAFLGQMIGVGAARGYWTLPIPTRLQLATLSSAGSDNPVGALANARLLPLVIQLLILVGLGALWKGWPFGPLRDPPGEGRLRFGDHVRALGTRYERLRATRHVVSRYAALWLNRMGPQGLRDVIEQERGSEEAARLMAALQSVAEQPEGPNRPDDLVLMEELWNITKPR